MDRFQVKQLEFVKKQGYFLKGIVPTQRLYLHGALKKHLWMVNFAVLSRPIKADPKPEGQREREYRATLWMAKG